MSHALVTICATIASERIEAARAEMEAMGNPARPDIAAALDRLDGDDGIHFVSLHAIPGAEPRARVGHLALEFSADGPEDAAIRRIVDRIGEPLKAVFAMAKDWRGNDLVTYLAAHRVRIGQGWFGQPGLPFAGTPGMTVGRIRREGALARWLSRKVGTQEGGIYAVDRVACLRAELRGEQDLRWALDTPEAPVRAPELGAVAAIAPLAGSFLATYLWPLAVPLLIVLAYGVWRGVGTLCAALADAETTAMYIWMLMSALWSSLVWLVMVALAFAVPVVLAAGALYLSLRRKEVRDWTSEAAPNPEVVRAILKAENVYAQNHMVSVTTVKPGLTRTITLRLAFWIIGALAGLRYPPGFLGDIGSIHFARWLTLPGTRQLVFFSNYGGSWESYLEDFITRAHDGLTAIWSNSVGFPRASNLFQEGATDGERFKRYARHSMLPTPFWYSAYPTLTTANIRTNAAIRRGIAAVMTDEEAGSWLGLFGSAARPTIKLESNQIQSIVFGGLGFLPYGTLLLIDLSRERRVARQWLRAALPHVAFNDGRRIDRRAVLTLALGPGALAKAGLPADAIASFPEAFLDGMTGPGRSRILGDHPDDPELPWWWRTDTPYDVALLVYGEDDESVAELVEVVRTFSAADHRIEREIPLGMIPKHLSDRKEPFGFVDGISQPVIRGTYRSLRNADPIHLVEPGEFILGYPDNRGNRPPGPSLKAIDDPDKLLPVLCEGRGGFGVNIVDAPREIGRNGSFLVIRQLEQDVTAFHDYCDTEAQRLRGRLGEPYKITADFIAAKLLGRWYDGSSLLRNPYQSYTNSKSRETRPMQRPSTHSESGAIAPSPAQPSGMTSRPQDDREPQDDKKKKADRAADNDYMFGTEDPQGLRCPFGAHVRRANPRDSFAPGSQDQIDISNRHRILRIGRTYDAREGEKNGLVFMCLNGDIERQFEFVQQTWLGSETFHGLSGERDALAGNREGSPEGFTIATRDGPIRLAGMARFVIPRGGGYFFLPGKRLLEFLSREADAH